VPYPVEAYPENNMKHLSAESALYALIYLEGMLGMELSANKKIFLNPSFPKEWTAFSLENVHLFNKIYSLNFVKKDELWEIELSQNDSLLFQSSFKLGEIVEFELSRK
jgi:cellobiose phosphorylase